MNRELEMLNNNALLETASRYPGSHKSWIAIDELARRTLENADLLSVMLQAMRADKAMKPHYVPMGTYSAIGRILNSENEYIIGLLLQEMNDWTAYEQEDAITPWAGNKRLQEKTQELCLLYNWKPKYV